MKKEHSHHTKKKSAKNHSSKAKVRKFSALTDEKLKLHTRTKTIKSEIKIENLKLAASKLPNKRFHTKNDIVYFLMNDRNQIPKKQIKLILNKLDKLTDDEINTYHEKNITLPHLIEMLVS